VSYDFDRLGFLQFEQLCSVLLELEGGVAADAWVGEADRLRSALSEVPLGPPLVASELAKPVLFECVWARLGSEYELVERVCSLTLEHPGEFAVARSFVLLTHLQVTGDFVTPVASTVGTPRVEVVVLGPDDLAGRIDARVELRRSMPSLLGIGDPTSLIEPGLADRSSLIGTQRSRSRRCSCPRVPIARRSRCWSGIALPC
jgi:hypothetical protein